MKPAWWLLVAGIAGLVIGAAWPPPPIPKAQQAEPAWVLPSAAAVSRHSREDYQRARQNVPWFGDQAAMAAGQSSGWRLAGIVASPELQVLAMRADTSKVTRMKVGQALPDGSKVVSIGRDRVTTELDGCKTVYQLHRPEPISTSGACSATGSDAE